MVLRILNTCVMGFYVVSASGASGVKNFKYMCSGILCCVSGLIGLSSWLFLCI